MAKKEVKILIHARDEASKVVKGIAGNFRQAFAGVTQRLKVVGAAVGGLAAAGAAVSVKLAAGFEQTRVSFETMLGDVDKATKLLKELTEFSTRTPFEPDEIFATSKQLLAFGFRAEEITTILQTIGDVSAGTGKDIQELGRIMGKVFTKGKAQGEELNQMAESGIPIIRELAKQYGVTASEVFELGSKGKISFDDINGAMTKMTTEGGVFFGMMDKQSQTLNGQISTLTGNVKELGRNFGEILLPAVKDVVTEMNDLSKGILESQGGAGFVVNFGAAVEEFLGIDGNFRARERNFLKERDGQPTTKQEVRDLRLQRKQEAAAEAEKDRKKLAAEQRAAAEAAAKAAADALAAQQRKKAAPAEGRRSTGISAFDRGGALQALVVRGLSGLSTGGGTQQAVERTEKNTAKTVNAIGQSNQIMTEMLKRMTQRGAYQTAKITG